MNKSRFLISSEAITLVFSSKQVSRTGSECCRGGENEEEGEKMASTDYSTYSQAAAQQGYSAYTAQPTQGYAQTTQAYGKQSYGTYGQPTDISYTQAQSTATYRQTAYATSYEQPPTGDTTPTAPRHSASLYKDVALVLMTPPLLQSPQPKPLVQLSLHMAPSPPTQPMASSQQPLHLQDHRMVTSP
ncbi:hypothetical protein ACRRTK_014395 [Alexandromys fortis]